MFSSNRLEGSLLFPAQMMRGSSVAPVEASSFRHSLICADSEDAEQSDLTLRGPIMMLRSLSMRMRLSPPRPKVWISIDFTNVL